ncbi:MAG: hypothetical protein IJ560_04635 [Alphaproteobacteria bacterium]|nr:hypothetical protein [Alphaproteobacteria bacterium]
MTIDEIKKLKNAELPRFSVFARDKLPLVGEKKRMGEILNRDLIVADFRIMRSKHNDGDECLQIQVVLDDQVYVVFTGSRVLIDQIRSVTTQIPFCTQITRVDKYFSFV